MNRFLFLLLLFVSVSAACQNRDNFWYDLNAFLDKYADKAYAKTDTEYVGRYNYRWDARTFDKASGLHVVSTFGGDINITSGICNRVGVGLSFRGVGLSFSKTIGKRNTHELVFDSYGKHFCFEYALRATNKLTGTVNMYESGDYSRKIDNLLLVANKLNLFYSFNRRFSYAAAMNQTKIQRRSAGSFIAALSWIFWDMVFVDEGKRIIDAFYDSNYFYQRFSIGAGYGYNLVLGNQHWLLHASLVPMWTFYEMQGWRQHGERERRNYPYGKICYSGTARAGIYYRWADRWSIGFSGVVNQMASRTKLSKKSEVFDRFGAQEWQATLSLAYRF